MPEKSTELPFRPHARLLWLLGDQLIRSPGIAAFELAKNAYDADAEFFRMIIHNPDSDRGIIEVEDDGSGMTWDIVTRVWLEPGSGHREDQRLAGIRSPKFNRLPMGEKGVGRFAAHKLGSRVEVVTRAAGEPEIIMDIDWDRFASKGLYLDEVKNVVSQREPQVFGDGATGTRIRISKLRQQWTRGQVRSLARAITSIQSPFDVDDAFRTELLVPDRAEWLKGLTTLADIRQNALYEIEGDLSGQEFTYSYKFRPRGLGIAGRETTRTVPLYAATERRIKNPPALDLAKYKIGNVRLHLLVYDLDRSVLAAGVTDPKGLKDYLKENGGIRVYRDGVRVFDYAEPGNDWLDLEGRRINRPTLRLSNNLVIGAVELDRATSTDLIEKTNREGFVENEAFRTLVDAIQSAIVHIEAERKQDKDRLRRDTTRLGGAPPEPILEDVESIRNIATEKGYIADIGPLLARIERDYREVRDTLLTSANAGLNLTVMLHEIEKGLQRLKRLVEAEDSVSPRIRDIAHHLSELVDGFGALARKTGNTEEKASNLVKDAVFNSEMRLEFHGIQLTVDQSEGDFSARSSARLVIATMMNVIDNSIWWLDHHPGKTKRIHILITRGLTDGPAIAIADNNTLGFLDPPEVVVRPFHTRRPGGMGLGLHLADQVMKAQNGFFRVIHAADVGLSNDFKAVVALIFPEAKWLA